MGALHAGHLSLVDRARRENGKVVCSIFVNPLQFNKTEDLETYPRTLERDLALLKEAGCDAVFCPSTQEMYPEKMSKRYDFGELDQVMEGSHRPGHFNGVAIVVNLLLEIVRPHRAYFGLKDYQQLRIVRRMAEMEGHSTEIIACETVREADGLAMSSRNVRLSKDQRREASTIYKALVRARQLYPHKDPAAIKQEAISLINASPRLEVEYFEIVDAITLQPLERSSEGSPAIACTAVYAGEVRLIDNLSLNA